jgi:hypothetical protein
MPKEGVLSRADMKWPSSPPWLATPYFREVCHFALI